MYSRNVYINMRYDEIYLNVIRDLLDNGERTSNRTGIDTLQKLGLYFEIDLQKEFPLLTTKKVFYKSAFAEMLGFIRGYTNAADFRQLGTNVWNQNANENQEWLNNSYRKGTDDLGPIYGSQWRNWQNNDGKVIDQLRNVYEDLKNNVDNRREIVLAWNPGELNKMSLPPCHSFFQFGLRNNKEFLDMFLFIRSNDWFLGNCFNVAQYSFLLHLMANLTNHKPGKLMIYCFNVHLYVNHIEQAKEQFSRSIRPAPSIEISDKVNSLEFLETTELPIEEWITIHNYDPHPYIKAPMAV